MRTFMGNFAADEFISRRFAVKYFREEQVFPCDCIQFDYKKKSTERDPWIFYIYIKDCLF